MAEFIEENTETEGKTLGALAKDMLTTESGTDTTPDTRTVGELLAATGLKIVHIRPYEAIGHKGMTFAFKKVNHNVMEVSTAILHRNDTFTKRTGSKVAIGNFTAGKTVFLPIIGGRKGSPIDTLKTLFGGGDILLQSLLRG